jgi:hypothetical protein
MGVVDSGWQVVAAVELTSNAKEASRAALTSVEFHLNVSEQMASSCLPYLSIWKGNRSW